MFVGSSKVVRWKGGERREEREEREGGREGGETYRLLMTTCLFLVSPTKANLVKMRIT